MMDGHQLARLVQDLMSEHGLTALGWVFMLDDCVARAGCCHHSDKTISLSKHIMHQAEVDIRNVLLHEIAHALAGPGHGHGKFWRDIALRIGNDGLRCHSLELKPPSSALACVLCGSVNALRHRVNRQFWRKATCSACATQGSITVLSSETVDTIVRVKAEHGRV